MPLMLPPAPRKRAAEASATKAINSVYSMRSWPCSSFQRLRKIVMVVSLLSFGFVFCDRVLITCLSFRDLAITAISAARSRDGFLFARRPGDGPEHERHAIV